MAAAGAASATTSSATASHVAGRRLMDDPKLRFIMSKIAPAARNGGTATRPCRLRIKRNPDATGSRGPGRPERGPTQLVFGTPPLCLTTSESQGFRRGNTRKSLLHYRNAGSATLASG